MGGSIINERVQIEVEALLDDYEEKKIAHERLRREEIKRMQDETKGEKAKLKEAAMRELESLKKTLQQSSLKDKDTRMSTRRAQLQSEQQKRLREVKEGERARVQQEERVIQQRLDRRRDQGKREEEQRHKAEI
jgi:hypothetical protein